MKGWMATSASALTISLALTTTFTCADNDPKNLTQKGVASRWIA